MTSRLEESEMKKSPTPSKTQKVVLQSQALLNEVQNES